MKRLACHVKDIGESAELIAKLEKTVREATALILEGYMMCSTQTKSSKFVNFFKTNVNKNELRNFRDELDRMYRHINTQINILSAKMKNTVVSSPYRHINTQNSAKMKNTVLSSPYPDAVGIEYSVNKVLGLFRWEIANKAIAIILHGPEGIGKSVLADAVFSKINTTEFCSKIKTTELKRSKVELFDKLNSASRDTVELQKLILRDLNGVEETPEIRKREDGQAEIRRILEKVEAIIYIDHVLGPDALGFLLPTNLNKVKKLRLLLTARNLDVCNVCKVCKVETVTYQVQPLPDLQAMSLLTKELDLEEPINPSEQITHDQLSNIVHSCGGNPQRLISAAQTILWEDDKERALRVIAGAYV